MRPIRRHPTVPSYFCWTNLPLFYFQHEDGAVVVHHCRLAHFVGATVIITFVPPSITSQPFSLRWPSSIISSWYIQMLSLKSGAVWPLCRAELGS